jgi:hypothetical protein
VFGAYGSNIDNIGLLNGRLQDRFSNRSTSYRPNGPNALGATARANGCLPLNPSA